LKFLRLNNSEKKKNGMRRRMLCGRGKKNGRGGGLGKKVMKKFRGS
jgi:hypothetical protein